ncbi:unnamed protein product [Rhizoctonia solani]|uniref:Uncharacterized protein n=1 Tax=Rhizoctonia solani TaxID=456999 RepID=A0A8H3BL69_9AGAM|nr:unnamed protein product [Rhizoctonia solani]
MARGSKTNAGVSCGTGIQVSGHLLVTLHILTDLLLLHKYTSTTQSIPSTTHMPTNPLYSRSFPNRAGALAQGSLETSSFPAFPSTESTQSRQNSHPQLRRPKNTVIQVEDEIAGQWDLVPDFTPSGDEPHQMGDFERHVSMNGGRSGYSCVPAEEVTIKIKLKTFVLEQRDICKEAMSNLKISLFGRKDILETLSSPNSSSDMLSITTPDSPLPLPGSALPLEESFSNPLRQSLTLSPPRASSPMPYHSQCEAVFDCGPIYSSNGTTLVVDQTMPGPGRLSIVASCESSATKSQLKTTRASSRTNHAPLWKN